MELCLLTPLKNPLEVIIYAMRHSTQVAFPLHQCCKGCVASKYTMKVNQWGWKANFEGTRRAHQHLSFGSCEFVMQGSPRSTHKYVKHVLSTDALKLDQY